MTLPSEKLLQFWRHSHVHPKTFQHFDQYHKEWELLAKYSNFQHLTSTNSTANNIEATLPLIPKVIHQIWLGKPMPKKYLKYIASIKRLNPEYGYKLWTDSDVKNLEIADSFLYKNTDNYGIKSDLLRYQILLNEGGWYFDCDFEAIKPLNSMNISGYNLILSPIPEPIPVLANGFIASSSSHLLMESLVAYLRSIKSINANPNDPNTVIDLVGATLLKKHFFYLSKYLCSENTLILPTNYMYAMPGYLRLANDSLKRSFSSSDSFLIHHWGCSWIPKPSLLQRALDKIHRLSSFSNA